ncbi:MAG: hypothetical protein JWM34_5208 [Ilumatobacteraceae bacterium]|nr:hypothetical protein [Ilumatobacteraceae bacterium]
MRRTTGDGGDVRRAGASDAGFTLVEILIAIVLVGILSAVVVVGIGRLTDQGGASACQASMDAAKTGSVAYFTGSGTYPTTLAQMTTQSPPNLTLSSGVTLNPAGTVASGSGWALTISPGTGLTPPTFACSSGAAAAAAAGGTTACPGTYTNWVGEYYANTSLSGAPALCRDDASLNFDWGGGAPATGLPADLFSGRWTRSATFTAGSHTFSLGSDDGSRLYIDGALVKDFWNDHGFTTVTVAQTLTAGPHTIVVEFYEQYGQAGVSLGWT